LKSEDGPGIRTEQEETAGERVELLRRYLEKKYHTTIAGMDRLDRGVLRVDRKDGKPWVVRVFPAGRTLERAQGDAEVLRFLEEHAYPAERCIREGDPVCFAGGRSFVITQFVEGRKPEKDEATVEKLGELLGRLHSLPVPHSGGPAREAGALHHYALNEGSIRNELEAAHSWLDKVEGQLPAVSRAAYDSLRRQLESSEDLKGLPETLTHPDPVLKNVLATSGGEPLTLIDWTGAGKSPRVVSFALLVWSAALSEHGWSGEFVDAVARGYGSRIELEKEEVASLAAAMRIRPLVFGCWCFRRSIAAGKAPDGTQWWMPDEPLVDAISSRARSALEL
jgi:Ser/Thr protein kinase RdoA (MazF antagonist)